MVPRRCHDHPSGPVWVNWLCLDFWPNMFVTLFDKLQLGESITRCNGAWLLVWNNKKKNTCLTFCVSNMIATCQIRIQKFHLLHLCLWFTSKKKKQQEKVTCLNSLSFPQDKRLHPFTWSRPIMTHTSLLYCVFTCTEMHTQYYTYGLPVTWHPVTIFPHHFKSFFLI